MAFAASRMIRASGCHSCHLSVLRAFASVSSALSSPAYQSPRSLRHSRENQTRLFSSVSEHATFLPGITNDEEGLPEEHKDTEDDLHLESSQSVSIPWYLQVESPTKSPRPLLDRQRIPDLPQSPPEILEPLLQHISVDMGVDDLSVLDLRHLDPPPALGANLLMIIGTARSEKHLHVSADRLCRWLRSEYKLRPDADGLLGRNELKLKMRRKNRRAKLLGSGTSDDNPDESIRTGWVCVNIGTVERTTTAERIQLPNEGFVGFGRQTEGVRIVVQMLVEEKRRELDLENLWTGIARRSIAESNLVDEAPIVASEQFDDSQNDIVPLRAQRLIPIQSSAALSPMFVQSRRLHTASKHDLPASEQSSSLGLPSAPIIWAKDKSRYTDLASIHPEIVSLMESDQHDAALQLVKFNISSIVEFQNDGWREYFLVRLQSYLENLKHVQDYDRAKKQLGLGWEDKSSTAYLRSVYHTISAFRSERDWEFLIWLQCWALDVRSPGYTTYGLSILFEGMQLSGCAISTALYLKVIRGLLARPFRDPSQPRRPRPVAPLNLSLVVDILEDMQNRAGDVLTEDLFVALQECIASHRTQEKTLGRLSVPRNAAVTTYNLPVLEVDVPDVQSRVNTLMSTLQIRVLSNENRRRLLTLYAQHSQWVEFWKLWRSISFGGEPREPALWALMFSLVAKTKHQHGCMTVLRAWIPDMDRADPEVGLEGSMLESVKACLELADPSVDMERLNSPDAKGEWISLWRRCLQTA